MEEELEKDMAPILLEDLGMRYPRVGSKNKRRYGKILANIRSYGRG